MGALRSLRTAQTKGPAEAATSPSQTLNIPDQEKAMGMDSDITAAVVSATADDEAVALTRRFTAAFLLNEHCDEERFRAQQADDFRARIYYETAARSALDEGFALKDALPFTKATTPLGAALQLNEAICLLEALRDDIPDAGDVSSVSRNFRALNRLIWSALDVLDGLAERKLESFYPVAVSQCCNPWISVEQRLAMAEAVK